MTTEIVSLENDLTEEQKQLLSDRLEVLMAKYSSLHDTYFNGVVSGLNYAYKLINEIDDDYRYE